LIRRKAQGVVEVESDCQLASDPVVDLAADQCRNDLMFDDVERTLEEGRSPILLTERRDHLEHFADRLRNFTSHLVVLHGGMSPRERRGVIAQLASIPEGEERLLLATGRHIGEGFDDARLDTLFLALPISWKGTLIQYSGWLHRLHPGKTEARIYDYVDRSVPMLVRIARRRRSGFGSQMTATAATSNRLTPRGFVAA
jgi:superfamily II DNA or RNA helicase